jgi:S1-C subfamily serine protease
MKHILIALLAFWLTGEASAGDAVTAGRDIVAKHQDAVVTVRMVVKSSMMLGNRTNADESKIETVGTVIDPSGLTVVSLATIDPSAIAKLLLRSMRRDMAMDSEFKDVKIVLADDTELSATVVMRDKDLDIVFIRPEARPAKPLAAIDLSKAATPRLLDEVITLNRLGKVADRTISVSILRIEALVRRPLPYYFISEGGPGGLGVPAFALDGAPLGILLMRTAPSDGGTDISSLLLAGGSGMGVIPIVVPAATLLESAKQALESRK